MIRRLFPALLAAALLTAGCGSSGSPPQVTFSAGQASATAGPTQFCDLDLKNCHNDPNAPVKLAVPVGTPLHVTVPQEVSSAPWQVVFTYVDPKGASVDGRSEVLAPNQHPDYTLTLPDSTDTLVTAQVQQYGPAPQADPQTGELQFPIRASWIVNNAVR